jgi:hypothetical protein
MAGWRAAAAALDPCRRCDRPYSKTQRPWREARTFHNVVLPGCDHLAACGFGAPLPPVYVAARTGFSAMYDDA